MDVVFYNLEGEKIGRLSPPCGGPRHFEPALTCRYYAAIKKPAFPVQKDSSLYQNFAEDSIYNG